jgi:hypothetical protein
MTLDGQIISKDRLRLWAANRSLRIGISAKHLGYTVPQHNTLLDDLTSGAEQALGEQHAVSSPKQTCLFCWTQLLFYDRNFYTYVATSLE